MKKRLILLISFLFLLCGCTANVNIEVKENGINEEVLITDTFTDATIKEQVKNRYIEFVPAFAEDVIVDTMPEKMPGVKYYDREISEINNGYNVKYEYFFGTANYLKARTVKNGFKSSALQKDTKEETLTLSTDSGGLLYFKDYPELAQVRVNITSVYKVLESNADSVNGNVYSWVFTPTTKKSIYILYDTKKEDTVGDPEKEDTKEENESSKNEKTGIEKFMNDHPILIASCLLVLFLIFVIISTKIFKK